MPYYYALTRFGRWEEMLKEPEPPAFSVPLRASGTTRAGSRSLATKRLDSAEAELARLKTLMSDESMKQPMFSPNSTGAALAPAVEVLAGEIAAARGNFDLAISHLDRAVRLGGQPGYTEPSEFHYPPRHALGAVLLEAGRASEAETVYWEDLRRNRENGWALFGLLQALPRAEQDGRRGAHRGALQAAWARADVTCRHHDLVECKV
jgi:tetratricopeptide (TPR) repeat protein